MRAVNLIPAEQRRGGGAGSSPLAVYALLGGLAVILVAVTALVLTQNAVAERQNRLAKVERQAADAERQARALAPYVTFATLQETRLRTVRGLARNRFPWSRAFEDVTRVMDRSVWLKSLTATIAPGVTLEDTGTDASTVRGGVPNPALEMSGCATSNQALVRLMSRLRAMSGVERVTLTDAEKPDEVSQSSSPSSGGSSDGCGSDKNPDWKLVVFYKPLPGGAPAVTANSSSTSAPAPPAAKGSTSSSTSTTPTEKAQAAPVSSSGSAP